MTEFLFFRHCETEMNTMQHLVGGRSNHTPPTARGKRQAVLLGDYLRSANIAPAAVFSSGAVRTDTTAALALERAGIAQPVIRDERLLELSQGEYEGLPRELVYTPENLARYNLAALSGKLPTGESILDVQQRKRAFLEETHERYPDGTVLVFGHGLAIRALAGEIRGYTKQQILAEETDNVSLTAIDVTDHIPTVRFVGKTVVRE